MYERGGSGRGAASATSSCSGRDRLSRSGPRPLPSDSNDAWRLGDVALRVCYRGDQARFEREALVVAELPASVKGPRLLDHGRDAELAWQVSAWVDGVALGTAWPNLDFGDRRQAITQLGEALAELNGYGFPPVVRTALAAPRPVGAADAAAVSGRISTRCRSLGRACYSGRLLACVAWTAGSST
jgi:hypothetical protein